MMHSTGLLSLSALIACALASPHVVHEKRDAHTDNHWSKVTELDSAAILPFRIGLKQSNLEHGDRWLMDVADPASPNYGKHWTAEEVINAFKPSDETVKAVHDWLHGAGIDSSRHRLSEGLNWLEFHATAGEAESLFKTKYHIFEHGPSDTRHVACDEYSLPSDIQNHVDFVNPGVHFDAKTRKNTVDLYDAQGEKMAKRAEAWGPYHGNPWSPHNWPGHHWPGPAPHHPPGYPHPPPPSNANICNDSFVTPYCLRTLYSVPEDLSPADGNSVGIVEYTPESFFQSDLDKFFSAYEPQAEGEAPVFDSIDGGFLYKNINSSDAFSFLGEPSLDLQYSMALLYPQNVVLYQVGDLAEASNTSFNNFLDAIDASYCTYDGGDVKGIDAVYPDPYPGPHSYKGKEDCGTYAPAKVISTSYSYDEFELPPSYEIRQCHEYMKLGLMGVTFAYSSGDYGVEGVAPGCLTDDGKITNGSTGNFVPTFPATCPYILSVGATQIRNGTVDVPQAVAAGKEVEVAMELYLAPSGGVGYDFPLGGDPIDQQIFSSAGGFSNVFAMPSYQKTAVGAYNKQYAPKYAPGKYNTSGTSRGFPDVSSNGAWFSIVVDGNFSQVFGTSCAAPTVSALLGLINGERLKAGKGSVGFVNPVLYQNPDVLNDITAGGNPGCGTYGFNAVPGWDPITGLGTPNFPKLLKLFMGLQ